MGLARLQGPTGIHTCNRAQLETHVITAVPTDARDRSFAHWSTSKA